MANRKRFDLLDSLAETVGKQSGLDWQTQADALAANVNQLAVGGQFELLGMTGRD